MAGLGTEAQRFVHHLEAMPRLALEQLLAEPRDNAREPLALAKPHALRSERYELDPVFARRDEPRSEVAAPVTLAALAVVEHLRAEVQRDTAAGMHADADGRAGLELTARVPDERIPRGELVELGQDLPHGGRRSGDLGRDVDFDHG